MHLTDNIAPSLLLYILLLLVGIRITSALIVAQPAGLKSAQGFSQSASLPISRTQLSMAASSIETNRIQWQIRSATPKDEDAVTELLTASYSTLLKDDYDPKILDEALPLITIPRPDLLTCGTWYVVEHPSSSSDGTLVGCGGWTRENPSTRNQSGHSHLRHFATHPDFLRKGVARAIWKQILNDVTTDKGIPTLEVYSTLTAQAFYESLGFRSVDPIYIPIPLSANCKFPSMIMRRDAEP